MVTYINNVFIARLRNFSGVQVIDLHNRLSEETRRADKSEFELKTRLEKIKNLEGEKEVRCCCLSWAGILPNNDFPKVSCFNGLLTDWFRAFCAKSFSFNHQIDLYSRGYEPKGTRCAKPTTNWWWRSTDHVVWLTTSFSALATRAERTCLTSHRLNWSEELLVAAFAPIVVYLAQPTPVASSAEVFNAAGSIHCFVINPFIVSSQVVPIPSGGPSKSALRHSASDRGWNRISEAAKTVRSTTSEIYRLLNRPTIPWCLILRYLWEIRK